MEGAPAAIAKQTVPLFVSVKIAATHLLRKFKNQLRILIPRKRWKRRRKRVKQVELRKMMKYTDPMHQREFAVSNCLFVRLSDGAFSYSTSPTGGPGTGL